LVWNSLENDQRRIKNKQKKNVDLPDLHYILAKTLLHALEPFHIAFNLIF